MKIFSNPEKQIGTALVLGAVLVLIPYSILTVIFEYPDILRQAPGTVLTRFHAGGGRLIAVWWAFAATGVPLLYAYVRLGQYLETRHPLVRWATTLGVLSGVVQIVGLLRWTFVVPVLARTYVETTDPATRSAVEVVFLAIHQFGGVVLGEHVGQLATIGWMVLMARIFGQLRMMPAWVVRFGYLAAGVYLLAQGELVATVVPGFLVWDLAGLLGSTLWLVWLVVVGGWFLKRAAN